MGGTSNGCRGAMAEPGATGLVEVHRLAVRREVRIQAGVCCAGAVHRAGPLPIDGDHAYAGGLQPAQDPLGLLC